MAISNPEETLEFHNVSDFIGENFLIPDYQRGYRWEAQQVTDLLNDLSFFYKEYPGESYSMQPIVVKRKDDKWEVVDGQQRLTTVLLILQALGHKNLFTIDYQVLENSKEHVSDIASCPDIEDINIFHMKQAYSSVTTWTQNYIGEQFSFASKQDLANFCFNNLKFLWYRADLVDDSPGEKIFRRLNIGKIELTQSELIKALFLSKDNYIDDAINLREELAHQWDAIESSLQNDEFWLFITDLKEDKSPTRIEFLLKYIYNNHKKEFFVSPDLEDDINARDALFRAYYNTFLNDKSKFKEIWRKINDIIETWQLWYEDVTLYHLLGFLLFQGHFSLKDLFDKWQNSSYAEFLDGFILNHIIKNVIDKFDPNHVYVTVDKNGNEKDHKRNSFPYLLLMNVLAVLRQNLSHLNNPAYRQGVYYKFPFHLLKKEIKKTGDGWDVEHIDSAATNSLDDRKSQREWVLSCFLSLTDDQQNELQNDKNLMTFFTSNSDDECDKAFESLVVKMSKWLEPSGEVKSPNKNRIYNFVLLDSSTNRKYKNAIFATKRQHIRNKTAGILHYAIWENGSIRIVSEEAKSAFVPPCTLSVFSKQYSFMPGSFLRWTLSDAQDYEQEMTSLFLWLKNDFRNERPN